MKTSIFKQILAGVLLFGTMAVYAQFPSMQYYRYNDKRGVNVFETSKSDTVKYEGLKIRVGGDFSMMFQGISHTNDGIAGGAADDLVELANNFSLPTANLNFDVQLADGVRMHLRTYLSSRHHTEAYVKGGYLQIDKLDFISPGFLSGLMEITTIQVGMDEINYGDTHFRRSDNARGIYNPFVGNYIMDSFTTEPHLEVLLQKNGIIGMVGISNGRLNQSPLKGDDGRVFYAKLGYDKQVNDDLRLRLTGSIYSSSDKGTRDYIYNGDRAGARYYNVIQGVNVGGSDFSGRLNPGFAYHNAFQINPFVKFQGVEFFGVFEKSTNGDDAVGGDFTQTGAELLYRFGSTEQLYIGGRYNKVTGKSADAAATRDISRTNFGFGWYMTNNILMKTEYVKQTYEGDGWNTTVFQGAEFDGLVIEAVIGF